jgi:hypothetical protein
MRTVIITVISLLIVLYSSAQIQGQFFIGNDQYGNKCVYFLGTNSSDYDQYIEVTCINYTTNETLPQYFKPLRAGNQFTIGPREGWRWQQSEILLIKYSNGKKIFWKYGSQNALYGTVFKYNPSFRGSNTCQNCGCTKFSESLVGHNMCKCTHSFDSHKFYK